MPIIIPLIVAGLAVGSAIRSESHRISRKMLAYASLTAGLLNAVYAYLLYFLFPRPSFAAGTYRAASQLLSTSEPVFLGESFLVGFLMVFAVLGIAMAHARVRRREELAEVPELASEGESTLRPS